MIVKLPTTKKGFYTPLQVELNARALDRIKRDLGGIISETCGLVGLSEALEASKIFVESSGINQPYTSPRDLQIGYTQISPNTTAYSLMFEFKQGRMSQLEENYLVKLIGQNRVDRVKRAKGDLELKGLIAPSELDDPAKNIFFGAIYFKQCLDRDSIAGFAARIDQAIVRYNMGFNLSMPKTANTDQLLLSPRLNKYAKEYILKLVGSTSPVPYAMKIFNT